MDHSLEVALVDGNDITGRVLLTTGQGHYMGEGHLMTMCHDSTMSNKTAQVICRQLSE